MLLALDSSLGAGSAAVLRESGALYVRHIPETGAQARLLTISIEAVLADAGISYQGLQRVVTTIGPGGFTGIRIALATACAIGFTAGFPVQGVSTLTCLAYVFRNAHPEYMDRFWAILPAGKGMVYAEAFDTRTLASDAPPALYALTEIEAFGLPLVTSRVSRIDGLSAPSLYQVNLDAEVVARLAVDPLMHSKLTAAEPLYIRPPDITLPKST